MSAINKLKREMWLYYKVWMKSKTFSPALNSDIAVTRKGWDHLISGSNSRKRNSADSIRRLGKLKLAKYVITHSQSFTTAKRNQENTIS